MPEEPASWANLGLTQLRLGELEAAAAADRTGAGAGAQQWRHRAARGPDGSRARPARRRRSRGCAAPSTLDAGSLRARFALADELQRLNTPEADTEALALLDEIVRRAPDNLAVLIERARIAARRRDEARLRDSRRCVGTALPDRGPSRRWSSSSRFRAPPTRRDFDDAVRATTFLRNVLAPVPAFRESLAAVRTPAELIAEPFDRFLALMPPPAQPSPADPSLTFTAEAAGTDAAAAVVALFPTIEAPPVLVAADATSLRRLDGPAISLAVSVWCGGVQARRLRAPSPRSTGITTSGPTSSMAGPGGVRLLLQDENGTFVDATAEAVRRRASHGRCVRCVGGRHRDGRRHRSRRGRRRWARRSC